MEKVDLDVWHFNAEISRIDISADVASFSESSLYPFKPGFIQSECWISDHVVRTDAVQSTYACINTSVYRLCINPFISFHFIPFHSRAFIGNTA